MAQRVSAIFKDGVFRPETRVDFSDSTRVRIIVEAIEIEVTSDRDDAWEILRSLWAAAPLDSGGNRLTRDAMHERR